MTTTPKRIPLNAEQEERYRRYVADTPKVDLKTTLNFGPGHNAWAMADGLAAALTEKEVVLAAEVKYAPAGRWGGPRDVLLTLEGSAAAVSAVVLAIHRNFQEGSA